MRIHTNTLTYSDIYDAARVARVDADVSQHGSRSRDHAFNVLLTGESRRRPNGGNRGAGDDYAATWDQWGIFLAELFARDESVTIPRVYDNAEAFASRTADRFGAPEVTMTDKGYADVFVSYGWPSDAHGDHRFKFTGTLYQQECTKCSAVTRWHI